MRGHWRPVGHRVHKVRKQRATHGEGAGDRHPLRQVHIEQVVALGRRVMVGNTASTTAEQTAQPTPFTRCLMFHPLPEACEYRRPRGRVLWCRPAPRAGDRRDQPRHPHGRPRQLERHREGCNDRRTAVRPAMLPTEEGVLQAGGEVYEASRACRTTIVRRWRGPTRSYERGRPLRRGLRSIRFQHQARVIDDYPFRQNQLPRRRARCRTARPNLPCARSCGCPEPVSRGYL